MTNDKKGRGRPRKKNVTLAVKAVQSGMMSQEVAASIFGTTQSAISQRISRDNAKKEKKT